MANAVIVKSMRDANWYFNPGEGYYYRKDKKNGAVLRLKCIHKNCNARAKVLLNNLDEDDPIGPIQMMAGVHVDAADLDTHLVETLHRTVLKRAENEDGNLNRIFEDEQTKYPLRVTKKVVFNKIDRGLRKRRAKYRPAAPNTLLELSQIIDQQVQLRTTYNNTLFFFAGNENNVLFCSPTTCALFNDPNTIISLDGTFKCTPPRPKIYQVFTIGGLIGRRFCTIAYCLMANKNTESYVWIFNQIRLWCPNFNPNRFIADFETGVAAAVYQVFNGATLQGCWFHYAQSIERKMRKLGLQRAMIENVEMRSVVKRIQALPLLPADKIQEGLDEILWYAQIHGINTPVILELINYTRRYWIQSIGVDRISVFQTNTRTNNAHEAFHSHVMLHMVSTRNGSHPNIWICLAAPSTGAATCESAEDGLPISFPQSRIWRQQHERIILASERLQAGQATVSEFLDWMAHHADFDLLDNLIQEELQMELEEGNFD